MRSRERVRTRRINTADDELPQIFSALPHRTALLFQRHLPRITFDRQTIQNRPRKRSVRYIVLEQERFDFGLFTFDFAQSPNEVTFGIARGCVPSIDGDEEFLTQEGRDLTGANANLGKLAIERRRENVLRCEGFESGRTER